MTQENRENQNNSENYLSLSGEVVDIDVSIHNPEWEIYLNDIKLHAAEVVESALNMAGYAVEKTRVELSIVLAENEFVADLNKRFLDQEKTTNVLSFPKESFSPEESDFYQEETDLDLDIDTEMPQHNFTMLGDIVFDYFTIDAEAKNQNKSFINHFYHLLIHGLLHLIGHDHENEVEASLMEQLEIDILAKFSIESPY